MPIKEFKCDACGAIWDGIRHADTMWEQCPHCKMLAHQIVSIPAKGVVK
jgi:putative FmdB family regulatory protein